LHLAQNLLLFLFTLLKGLSHFRHLRVVVFGSDFGVPHPQVSCTRPELLCRTTRFRHAGHLKYAIDFCLPVLLYVGSADFINFIFFAQ